MVSSQLPTRVLWRKRLPSAWLCRCRAPPLRASVSAMATRAGSGSARQQIERHAAGLDWTETGYVFTTKVGTPIEPDNLRRSWYPLRSAAGLGDIVFHGLRHTCVTLLLDLGVPPHIVRDIVGHSAIEVTMTIYAHASLDEKRNALRKLDDHLQ